MISQVAVGLKSMLMVGVKMLKIHVCFLSFRPQTLPLPILFHRPLVLVDGTPIILVNDDECMCGPLQHQ